ncbi:MAG: hypothetical protein IT163_10900 [Bryobacterales bacterium]|nr:hypothetical protein [Bryobacterales bacterium]
MRYAASNVTTFVMLMFTVWIIITRFRAKPDNNWPLFYYLAVVSFHLSVPGFLNEWILYAGVVSALLLRFEFLGGFAGGFVRVLELVCLAGLAYQFGSRVTT